MLYHHRSNVMNAVALEISTLKHYLLLIPSSLPLQLEILTWEVAT